MIDRSDPPRRSTLRWKILAAAGIISVALALVLFQNKHAIAPIATASKPITAGEILKSIPAPTGDSASEKAVAEGLAKVRTSPDNAVVWTKLGDALAQRLRDSTDQSLYDSAGKAYERALALDGNNVAAMNGMAWVTGGAHKFDESIALANKSMAITPQNADALGILGDVHLELGDYESAFDEYQKMMDLRPDLSSWSRGAYLLWLNGDTLKATSLMQQAIRSGGAFAENTAWCRAKLATMYFHDGSDSAAAQVLEPSLRAHSKNPHVLLAAAQLAEAMQEPDMAAEYYKMMLKDGPQHDALAGLGDLHAAKGETAEAESYYKQVEELHAAHLATGVHDHTKMALFLADHDRNLVEALRLAEQHKLTRNVLEADSLAWVYFKNGDNEKAIKAIKLALSRNTPDSSIHYHAGMIALKAGDMESAQRHLQVALALNPHFSVSQSPIARRALDAAVRREALPTAAANTNEPGK